MNDHEENAQPVIRRGSRLNKVWIVPFIAILLGGWLVKRTLDERGEVVTILFETADGLTANKTEVKCRNVTIGLVEDIRLTKDLKVEVSVRIKPGQLDLIRDDSKFWVERARVQGASVSALDTLVKGAFIGLDPGTGEQGTRNFKGFETPPVTPSSVEGLRLTLTASDPGSIAIGSGIYFQNILIGKVERRTFKADRKLIEFGVFVEEEFASLITRNTHFWRNSGISVSVGADGFDVNLPSLDSLVSGRISVGIPEGLLPGDDVDDDARFALYESLEQAKQSSFDEGVEFLLLSDKSLRGLKVGSPVEFRGLKVGHVGRISYDLVEESEILKIPILVQLDDRLMRTHFPSHIIDEGHQGLEKAFQQGLRASIRSSNLLTGQMYVDLDYQPDASPAQLERIGKYVVIPTIETGLGGLEEKVAALLDKFNRLDLEGLVASVSNTSDEATETLGNINRSLTSNSGVVADARKTLQEMTETLTSVREILASEDTKNLPGDLRKTLASVNATLEPLSNNGAIYGDLKRTLDELRGAVRSIERMATEISDKPNSLLFGKNPGTNKIPRARR